MKKWFLGLFLVIPYLVYGMNEQNLQGEVVTEEREILKVIVNYQENEEGIQNVIQYFSKSGRLVLEEFGQFLIKPLRFQKLRVTDYIKGRKESFSHGKRMCLLKFKRTSKAKFKEKRLRIGKNTIHGTMMTHFIKNHLDRIKNGKKVKFRLLVPSRLRTYKFYFTLVGEELFCNQECFVIQMKPSSIILRAFVPPSIYTIQKDPPHQLLKYDGIISLRSSKGKVQTGVVRLSLKTP